jgi:hypothetical protein
MDQTLAIACLFSVTRPAEWRDRGFIRAKPALLELKNAQGRFRAGDDFGQARAVHA